MKDKKLKLIITRYDLIGATHWYLMTDDYKVLRRFKHFEDARKYALQRAYAKNID